MKNKKKTKKMKKERKRNKIQEMNFIKKLKCLQMMQISGVCEYECVCLSLCERKLVSGLKNVPPTLVITESNKFSIS